MSYTESQLADLRHREGLYIAKETKLLTLCKTCKYVTITREETGLNYSCAHPTVVTQGIRGTITTIVHVIWDRCERDSMRVPITVEPK